jgi:hypothetical protein
VRVTRRYTRLGRWTVACRAAAERGDLQFEIGEEANRIMERIRTEVADAGNA